MVENIVFNNLDEEFIKEIADSKFIFRNGREYFKLGRVKSLDVKGDMIEAVVRGKLDYKVRIYFNRKDLNGDDDSFNDGPVIGRGKYREFW